MGRALLVCLHAEGDRGYLGDLERHLSPAVHEGWVELWSDDGPGSDRQSARRVRLTQAHVVVLLLSADFTASDECQRLVREVLREQRRRHLLIVPIVVRAVDWRHGILRRLPALPFCATPIESWPDRDVAWQRIAQGLRALIPLAVCPFPGLDAFDEAQGALFPGRRREIKQALRGLGRTALGYRRWLQIEGTSGAGKSSLARAGLLPPIRRGLVRGAPADWVVVDLRPAMEPLRNLALALLEAFAPEAGLTLAAVLQELGKSPDGLRDLLWQHVPKDHGVLLFIDQLEEIFTLAADAPGAVAHFDALLSRALDGYAGLHLLTTIRSDFTDRFASLPSLDRRLNLATRYHLRPMRPAGLRATLLTLTRKARVTWEPGLLEQLLLDAAQERNNLCLVGCALRALWEQSQDGLLTRQRYRDLKGIGGALSQRADDLLQSIGSEAEPRVRRLFLHLVRVRRGEVDVRVSLSRAEAQNHAGGDRLAERILIQLSGSRDPNYVQGAPAAPRLLVIHGAGDRPELHQVEIVHDTLLLRWETLRKWLDADRRLLERHEDLKAEAGAWKAAGCPDKDLGEMLAYYEGGDLVPESRRRYLDLCGELERRFLQSAQEIAARRARREAAQQRDRRFLRVASGLLVLAAGLVVTLWVRAKDARWTETWLRAAAPGHMKVESLASSFRSLDALRQAAQAGRSPPSGFLASLAANSNRLVRHRALRGHTARLRAASLSPDGARVVTASEDATARVWDAATGRELRALSGHSSAVRAAAFCGGNARVITAGEDESVRVWDLDQGTVQVLAHGGAVLAAACSPDGRRAAIGGRDGAASVWDLASSKVVRRIVARSAVQVVAFSPSGQQLLVGDDRSRVSLEDLAGQQPAKLLGDHRIVAAAFAPLGNRVLTVGAEADVNILDGAEAKLLRMYLGHSEDVLAGAFSTTGWDSGRWRFATGGVDGSLRIWSPDWERKLALFSLDGPPGIIGAVAFLPDGGLRAVTISHDDHRDWARVWDVRDGRVGLTLEGHAFGVRSAFYSPTGTRLVTAGNDGTARIWDAATGRPLRTLDAHAGTVMTAVFSPGEDLLATGGNVEKLVKLWDARTWQLRHALRHEGVPWAIAFSPDGRTVVTAAEDGQGRIWDVATGERVRILGPHGSPVQSASYSPDGAWIVTGSRDGQARIWEAATARHVGSLIGHTGWVMSASYSPDGRRIVTASSDGTAAVWDAATRERIGVLSGHGAGLTMAAYSPDGRLIVTAGGADRAAMVWDGATLQRLLILEGHIYWVKSAAFSPDSRWVVTASDDASARVYPIDWRDYQAFLCDYWGAEEPPPGVTEAQLQQVRRYCLPAVHPAPSGGAGGKR